MSLLSINGASFYDDTLTFMQHRMCCMGLCVAYSVADLPATANLSTYPVCEGMFLVELDLTIRHFVQGK